MFWGCVVTEGKTYQLPKSQEYDCVHISNVGMAKESDSGKTYLMLTKGKETYTIAVLQKDKVENQILDLYVQPTEDIKLSVVGKAELHVTGYFEPPEMESNEALASQEEAEVGSESEEELPKHVQQKHKEEPKGKAETKKEAKKDWVPEEEEEEEEDDSESDEEADAEEIESFKEETKLQGKKRPAPTSLPSSAPMKKAKKEKEKKPVAVQPKEAGGKASKPLLGEGKKNKKNKQNKNKQKGKPED